MENGQKLTKKEKKELRKLEWQETAKKQERNAKIKKYSIWAGAVAIILVVVFGLIQIINSSSSTPGGKVIKVAPVTAKDITKGNSKSKVVLIEYSDFQCPACAAYHPLVNQLVADYSDKILFVYRMFPLTNIHPNSHISAQAAYAALKQGKFFEMSDLLFSNQTDWAEQSDPTGIFTDYARKLNLNLSKFQTEMNSSEAKNYVNNSETEAISEGMNETPTFILDGVKITNPQNIEDFKKLIDQELKKYEPKTK